MNVIKQGDLSLTKKKFRFECKECGCIFECTENECTLSFDMEDGGILPIVKRECPTCNNWVLFECYGIKG